MTTRGNPTLKVRLDPDLVEETNQAFPAVKGRSGGVALALRRLLYLALDKPMPKQFGEIGRSRDIDALEDAVRVDSTDAAELAAHEDRAKELLATDPDPVDVLRLRAVLGRLHLLENKETEPPRPPTSPVRAVMTSSQRQAALTRSLVFRSVGRDG